MHAASPAAGAPTSHPCGSGSPRIRARYSQVPPGPLPGLPKQAQPKAPERSGSTKPVPGTNRVSHSSMCCLQVGRNRGPGGLARGGRTSSDLLRHASPPHQHLATSRQQLTAATAGVYCTEVERKHGSPPPPQPRATWLPLSRLQPPPCVAGGVGRWPSQVPAPLNPRDLPSLPGPGAFVRPPLLDHSPAQTHPRCWPRDAPGRWAPGQTSLSRQRPRPASVSSSWPPGGPTTAPWPSPGLALPVKALQASPGPWPAPGAQPKTNTHTTQASASFLRRAGSDAAGRAEGGRRRPHHGAAPGLRQQPPRSHSHPGGGGAGELLGGGTETRAQS